MAKEDYAAAFAVLDVPSASDSHAARSSINMINLNDAHLTYFPPNSTGLNGTSSLPRPSTTKGSWSATGSSEIILSTRGRPRIMLGF